MSLTVMSLSNRLLVIQQQLTRYCYSIYLVFGITGGCLNILLLSRTQFRTSSCCIYLLVMSVATLILLSWVGGLYLYALDHVDPVTSMLVFCKMRIYVLQSSAYTYRWCLTVACFDRYALTSVHVHLRNIARASVARRAVIIVIVACITLPMYTLIFYNLKGNTCGIVYSTAAALYHSIFTTVAAAVLPTSIMMTCALLIYRNLIDKQQRRQGIRVEQPSRLSQTSRRDQQVLLMLLAQAICYVGTTVPLMGMYFYNALTIYVSNKSNDRLAIEKFAFFLSELINFLFPACSFYLYTLASHIFRQELIRTLSSIFRCRFLRNTTAIVPASNDIPIRSVTETRLKSKSVLPFSINHTEKKTTTLASVQ